MDAGTAPVASAGGAVAPARSAHSGRQPMAGCQRYSAAQYPGRLVAALSGQGLAAEPFRQPRPVEHRAQSAAVAAAAEARRTGAASFERAVGFIDSPGLQRPSTDSRGALAGVVWSGRYATDCRRPASGQAASAVASAATGAGHAGPGQLLAQHLCRGEEGSEGALSEAIP